MNKPSYLGMLFLAMLLNAMLVLAVKWSLPENPWEILIGFIIVFFSIILGEMYGSNRE